MMTVVRLFEPQGTRTPYGAGDTWPGRTDMHLAERVTPDDLAGRGHWTHPHPVAGIEARPGVQGSAVR